MSEAARLDVAALVIDAEQRIRGHIRQTALERSNFLSQLADADVYLKLESNQITGSFKLRGAMNKMLALSAEERTNGVLTASSGNHGAACAYLMTHFGIPGTIFLPESVSPAKLEAIRSYGADTELVPGDGIEAEKLARRLAAERGQTYVSPYNDPSIIGGQGTIGLELRRQTEDIDAVLVPVGGGGLVAGVGGYLKSVDQKVEIIGCQPENSPVMYESIQAGEIIDMESRPTLADGTAGGIDHDSITFDVCRDVVDGWELLSEQEIADAILVVLDKQHLMVEGAAALPIACLMRNPRRFAGQSVVLLVSGSKLGLGTLRALLAAAERG
ncbi:MAG: threonine/serine dehydratase [Acidobacteria bacterium]|nr:threonine/serine dehydratase [Acidobacteriota bacterium]